MKFDILTIEKTVIDDVHMYIFYCSISGDILIKYNKTSNSDIKCLDHINFLPNSITESELIRVVDYIIEDCNFIQVGNNRVFKSVEYSQNIPIHTFEATYLLLNRSDKLNEIGI